MYALPIAKRVERIARLWGDVRLIVRVIQRREERSPRPIEIPSPFTVLKLLWWTTEIHQPVLTGHHTLLAQAEHVNVKQTSNQTKTPGNRKTFTDGWVLKAGLRTDPLNKMNDRWSSWALFQRLLCDCWEMGGVCGQFPSHRNVAVLVSYTRVTTSSWMSIRTSATSPDFRWHWPMSRFPRRSSCENSYGATTATCIAASESLFAK